MRFETTIQSQLILLEEAENLYLVYSFCYPLLFHTSRSSLRFKLPSSNQVSRHSSTSVCSQSNVSMTKIVTQLCISGSQYAEMSKNIRSRPQEFQTPSDSFFSSKAVLTNSNTRKSIAPSISQTSSIPRTLRNSLNTENQSPLKSVAPSTFQPFIVDECNIISPPISQHEKTGTISVLLTPTKHCPTTPLNQGRTPAIRNSTPKSRGHSIISQQSNKQYFKQLFNSRIFSYILSGGIGAMIILGDKRFKVQL